MPDFNIHEILRNANEEINSNSNNKEAFGLFTKIFNELPETQLEAINYFVKIMPENDDITLIVIKGHLLLEEQVKNIFLSKFKNPNILEKSRFEISQIINITEATFKKNNKNECLWKCIRKLNNIRNDIAHNIENKGLENKVKDLVDIYNKIATSKIKDNETIEKKLKACISGLGAQLISLATHSVKDRKAKDKADYFNEMYQNDYAQFDDVFSLIDHDNLTDDEIEEKRELDLFKKCADDTFFKLLQVVDVTNSEYIDATYGALLSGRERAEQLSGDKLKNSIEELKQQHEDLIIEMNKHFKDTYDELMIKMTDELKLTLSKNLKKDTGI